MEHLKIKTYPSDYNNQNNITKCRNLYLNTEMLKNVNLTKIKLCYFSLIDIPTININIIANKFLVKLFHICEDKTCCGRNNRFTMQKTITKNIDILKYFNDLCKHKIYKNKFNKNTMVKTLNIMYMNNISPDYPF